MPLLICSIDNPRGSSPRVPNYQAGGLIDALARTYGWQVSYGVGCYRGAEENSIVIWHQSPEEVIAVLLDVLEAAGQESVIKVDARGFAELHYLGTDKAERLGRWTEIGIAELDDQAGWTKLGEKFFTCA